MGLVIQKEGESVTTYVDKFWTILLKVTPFMNTSNEEKMRKFDAGLLYPNNSLRRMMVSHAQLLLSALWTCCTTTGVSIRVLEDAVSLLRASESMIM